jgi:hypothetical protein
MRERMKQADNSLERTANRPNRLAWQNTAGVLRFEE